MPDVRDVIIIGSGPAGYTAGLYAGRAMLKPIIFAGFSSGGQLMLTSDIENFPGYPEGIGGPEMMMELRAQAAKFGCDIIDKNVDSILELAKSEVSLEKQSLYYRDLQEYLLKALPYIPLWYEDNVLVSRSNIKGYTLSTDGNFDSLEHVKKK